MLVEYSKTCDNCGKEFKGGRTWDMTQQEEGRFVIDIDMFGGFEMRCPHCGAIHYIPCIDDFVECEEARDFESYEEEED
jgi:DNA-directed RNA polymerase subunit RPC12/RpoP